MFFTKNNLIHFSGLSLIKESKVKHIFEIETNTFFNTTIKINLYNSLIVIIIHVLVMIIQIELQFFPIILGLGTKGLIKIYIQCLNITT